jgi:hypothetical protein
MSASSSVPIDMLGASSPDSASAAVDRVAGQFGGQVFEQVRRGVP